MRKHLLLVLIILLFTGKIAAQSITGTVVDAQKEPMPGVSVIVKGTSSGTVTDAEGKFELNIADASTKTLVFTYLGYKTQEYAIGRNSSFNVLMEEDTKQLEELVVIGYGVQKKSLVTGAISQVTSQAIENKQITRVDNALQGLTSGVTVTQHSGEPGSSPNVYIRGVTTINNSGALYVVDGIILNGGQDYLNPNDIASIEVLKDAASCAIYGTRAANGVILITTKKGSLNSPMKVSYNMQMGEQGPTKKVALANASQYAYLRNISLINEGKDPIFDSPSIFGTGTNWQDQIFSNSALYQNHSLSISGGNDKSTYYASLGYIGQQGIVAPDIAFSNSLSVTVNTTFKIGKYVTAGENLSYTNRKNNTSVNTNSEFGGPLSSALNLDPITPVLADDALGATYPQYALQNAAGHYYAISQYVGQEMTNPVADITRYKGNYWWSNNLVGSAYINVNPGIKGLNLRSQINVKQAFWGQESFTPLFYLNTMVSNTNQTTQWREMHQNLSWNWDNTISYDFKTGLHTIGLMAGMSALDLPYGMFIGVNYIGEPATSSSNASFNYSLPQAQRQGSASDDQPYKLVSYFGRVNYNYDERYLLSGIIRRDGSTKFGSNNRYGTFPSVQLGWVVTREKFFPMDTFLDNLKIRLGYGTVGNDMSLANFQYVSTIQGGGRLNAVFGPGSVATGYGPTTPANPNLKWEQTSSFDAGFDAMLFKGFSLNFDYYNKATTGMLMQVQVPGFSGYVNQPWANVGNMRNRGVEFEAGYKKNIGKDFKIDLHGNIAYNQNVITYLGDGKDFLDGGPTFQVASYPLTRMAVGHPIGAFYGFKDLGTFKSQDEINAYGYTDANGAWQLYQPNAKPGDLKWWKNPNNPDDNGSGKIGQGDRTWIGDALPHWTYGFTLNFSWKSWDLMAFGQGVWGNKIFQAYRRLDIGAANYSLAAVNTWTLGNPNSEYPRLSESDLNQNFSNPSDFYLQDGAYLRLKTLQLGYTIPKELIHKIGLQRIRIYGSISNLFTLTKYNGYDPEVGGNLGAGANGQNNGNFGVDYGIYPQARTFLFGLNVDF